MRPTIRHALAFLLVMPLASVATADMDLGDYVLRGELEVGAQVISGDTSSAKFDEYRDEHIAAYGPENELRLTGTHETQSIDKFSYGIADRGASIRVPHSYANADWKGYLEDRRPNSQGDPYKIAARIAKTVKEVEAAQ